MAHTLLSYVNRALKRVKIIQGEVGELTSLTDSARQSEIDIMVQCIQETVDDLLEVCSLTPKEISSGTITLVTSTREYALASDFEGLAIEKFTDETDGYWMLPYNGGFEQMIRDQEQPGNYTGTPYFYAINPENGYLRVDRSPDIGDNGRVYTYRYVKEIRFTTASDTFPVSDQVLEALMPAVKEVWNRENKEKFDGVLYQRAMARAANNARQHEQRKYW